MTTILKPLAAAALAFALAGIGGNAAAAARFGQPAPEVVMPELDGQVFDLAQARGKVVILSLWATWCAPCRAEMPILDQAYKAHGAEGLEVVGMSADRLKSRSDVVRVMADFHYPSGMALEARTNGFGVPRALPQTFVIDRKGVVRGVFGVLGDPVDPARLEAAVRPLLAEGP